MKTMSTFSGLFALFSLLLSPALAAAACETGEDGCDQPQLTTQIEFLGVRDLDAAREYGDWLSAYAAHFGVGIEIYEVTETMKGEEFSGPTFLLLLTYLERSQLTAIGEGAAYKARVPERDRIFDFGRQTKHLGLKLSGPLEEED